FLRCSFDHPMGVWLGTASRCDVNENIVLVFWTCACLLLVAARLYLLVCQYTPSCRRENFQQFSASAHFYIVDFVLCPGRIASPVDGTGSRIVLEVPPSCLDDGGCRADVDYRFFHPRNFRIGWQITWRERIVWLADKTSLERCSLFCCICRDGNLYPWRSGRHHQHKLPIELNGA